MIVQLVLALVAALVSAGVTPPAASVRAVPTRAEWLSDVHHVLAGAPDYVRARAEDTDDHASGDRLALNLDIDNTSIASYYGGGPIREMLELSRIAQRHHVAVLFNTARDEHHRAATLAQLRGAGYHVDGLCMRHTGETKAHSKQRCRAQFTAAGYTLIADLGNNPTDFAGSGYDRAYRLPNYDGVLP